MKAEILEQFGTLVLVNKPPGQAVHPATGVREMALTEWVRHATGLRVAPIHRLDRATSGLVLLSSDPKERAHWGRLFSEGLVDKQYLAMVSGRPPAFDTVESPLFDQRRKRLVPAQTALEVARYYYDAALVVCAPKTGRKHQLRRHLSTLGHPILGDTRYGAHTRGSTYQLRQRAFSQSNRPHAYSKLPKPLQAGTLAIQESMNRPRLWLHALSLKTSEGYFESPYPHDFEGLCKALTARDEQLNM